MTEHLDVVVAQSPAELNGTKARLDWLSRFIDEICHRPVDLLVLPELFLSGYNVGPRVAERAESRDGPLAQKIAAMGAANNLAILYGFPERADDVLYNSATCFSPDGDYLGGHRKLLLPPGYEGDAFAQGEGCTLFTIGAFNVAVLICYDIEFPENARAVAGMGADVVLVPTALGAQWGVVSERMIPTRAFENGVYLCYANHCGSENGLAYFGGSCIIGPDGKDLARAGAGPTFLAARLIKENVAAARARLPYLQDRGKLPWVR